MTGNYRADIDGLRAVAVLAVVVFHAFPALLPGGFVGVDVFFVISGFLITSILWGDLKKDRFSIIHFYSRRIRRIFPSLIGVLILSLICGFFLLDTGSFQKLGWHTFGGALFISNFILLQEVDYFDISSAFKPLLHLWSLGVEEQYYILWPPLIFLLYKTKNKALAGVLTLIALSFGLSLYAMDRWSSFDFYSPATRAWELFLGGVLAISQRSPEKQKSWSQNLQSTLGLILLIASFFLIRESSSFPGYLALGPAVGSFLLLRAGPESFLNRKILALPILVKIGLISYPLYLLHWPALVFSRAAYSGPTPAGVRLAAVAASFALATVFYQYLEKPIRFGRTTRPIIAYLLVAMLATGALGLAFAKVEALQNPWLSEVTRQFRADTDWPYWDDPKCVAHYRMSPCQATGFQPTLVILGDSHGNHLFPGLAKRTQDRVVAAGTCPPLLGVRLVVEKNQKEHPCGLYDYLSQNLMFLEKEKSARVVVLATYWNEALQDFTADYAGGNSKWGDMKLSSEIPGERGLPAEELVWRGLMRTIERLRALSVRIILVRDVFGFSGSIFEFCSFTNPNCTLDKNAVLANRAPEDRFIERLKREAPDVLVFDPIPLFCDETKCFIKRDGHYLLRDDHHLSVPGSELMAEGLAPLIQ